MTAATREFRDWLATNSPPILGMATATLREGHQLVPMLFVFADSSDTIAVLPLDFETMRDKDLAAALHRTLAAQSHVRGVVLVTEAWVVERPDDKAAAWADLPVPAEEPDRKEVVMLNALSGDMQLIALYPIERPACILGTPTIFDSSEGLHHGRFVRDHETSRH